MKFCFGLRNVKEKGATNLRQILYTEEADVTYSRNYNNGTWTSWNKLTTETDLNNALANLTDTFHVLGTNESFDDTLFTNIALRSGYKKIFDGIIVTINLMLKSNFDAWTDYKICTLPTNYRPSNLADLTQTMVVTQNGKKCNLLYKKNDCGIYINGTENLYSSDVVKTQLIL